MRFEDYAVNIAPIPEEEGGGYLVTLPDLPGCIADGETIDAAIAEARDAFLDSDSAFSNLSDALL